MFNHSPPLPYGVYSVLFGLLSGSAGKTTTLSILSGEFPPTVGDAYIDGYVVLEYNA